MASIGLSEAARLTGRNQSTIHRAMKAGRLSYTVDETGERRIDTAELDRVFSIRPIRVNGASANALAQPVQSHGTHEDDRERVIAAQRETIAQQDATIRDLRARLDTEVEERRRLIAMLVDRRPWWRRWFR